MATVMDPGDDGGRERKVHSVGGDIFMTTHISEPPKKQLKLGRAAFVSAGASIYIVLFGIFFALKEAKAPKGSMAPPGGGVLVFQIMAGGTLLIFLGFAIPWFLTRRTYMKNQNAEYEERLAAEREYARQALENLKKATELATLMQLNQGQIKTYHDIVTDQADKSFKSSRIAMNIGMVLLVCAAIGGASVPLEEVRWFIAALAAFSTLLSGYLSRTYLTLYKESIGQLNRYFDQPVMNSYFLTAERLTQGLAEEHRDEIRKQVITEVLRTSSRLSGKPEPKKEQKPRLDGVRTKKRKPKKQASPANSTERA